MQKIRKAVIPAAGLGTRVLPATKAMPKEMLPIVDKPAIQYIVEEAVAAGIEEILIITGRGKGIMEDHFDRAPELEAGLAKPGKEKMLEDVRSIAGLADIFFLRQKETKGLGHAILKARPFTQDEPFVVLYGDDVIMGEDPVAAQLCRAYAQYRKACVGIKEVSRRYREILLHEVGPSFGQPVQHHRHDREACARTGIQPVLHPGTLPAYTGDLRHPREDAARRGRRDPAYGRHGRAGAHRRHDGR